VTGAEQRECPACGAEFTWTTAAPRQRFCSTPCRQRWWDRTRRQRQRRHGDDPRGHDPRRPQDSDKPRPPAGDPRGHDDPATVAVPACPHCRQPVAIVAWLVPPAAASVATPARHADQNT
jgi:endogenous inhibitor of DNA gyrase (YacG/DUF329 family)